MYRPGKILQFGGNSNRAITIDINGASPVVTTTLPNMSSQRQWVTATVLADGRVLATGGSSADNQLTNVNNSAEVWDPNPVPNGTWRVGPNGLRARLYHSIALLLPDATVLVGGGGAPGPLVNRHVEIYRPSYLYDGGGNLAPRPVIQDVPDVIALGQTFSFGVGAADIRRVTLVKTGTVTHSVNMDQRFIELSFTSSAGTLFVQPPATSGNRTSRLLPAVRVRPERRTVIGQDRPHQHQRCGQYPSGCPRGGDGDRREFEPDQPELGRGHRQRWRDGLPGRALRWCRVYYVCERHDSDGDDVQQHRSCRIDDISLSRPGDGCRRELRAIHRHREGNDAGGFASAPDVDSA